MYKLYDSMAWAWPIFSPPEGYALESLSWKRVLRDKLGEGRHRILALGVGGGNHLLHLKDEFEIVATDLSAKILEISKELNPELEHRVADMRSFDFPETFDAVLVHDAIAYLKSRSELSQTFARVFHHLRPGGVFVTSPDHTQENFQDPTTRHRSNCYAPGKELTFFEYIHDPDPGDELYETLYVYLLREGGGRPKVVQDTHVHGLFPKATWTETLAAEGFQVETRAHPPGQDPDQGFLLIGTKPPGTESGIPSQSANLDP